MTAPPPPHRPRPPRRASGLALAGRRLGKGAERAVTGFVNGLDFYLREPEQVVDTTPWRPVLQRDKLTVRRYLPLEGTDWGLGATADGPTVPRRPVVLVPPLMVRPFIFDLVPERSLVRSLLAEGFDVYVVDFGAPDADDEHVRLETYVLDWLPAALAAVRAASGQPRLALAGYCMGGLFALMLAAAHEDPDIAAIVTIGSPIDTAKMGVLSLLARHLHKEIDAVSRRLGNVPGPLSSQVFKLMNPWKAATRHAEAFLHLYDQAWLDGFDALEAWTSNFVDYPGDAFRQLMDEFITGNKLKDGQLRLGDREVDLRRVTAPVLAFAGRSDNVVRPEAAEALLQAVGSADKTLLMAPGGHMAVLAGRSAPQAVWRPMAAWLAGRG